MNEDFLLNFYGKKSEKKKKRKHNQTIKIQWESETNKFIWIKWNHKHIFCTERECNELLKNQNNRLRFTSRSLTERVVVQVQKRNYVHSDCMFTIFDRIAI